MSETKQEEYTISAKDLKEKVEKLIEEGNARKITVKNKDGNVIMVIPVNAAVVGTVIAPTLAAVGAIAAFLTECTLVIEKK